VAMRIERRLPAVVNAPVASARRRNPLQSDWYKRHTSSITHGTQAHRIRGHRIGT